MLRGPLANGRGLLPQDRRGREVLPPSSDRGGRAEVKVEKAPPDDSYSLSSEPQGPLLSPPEDHGPYYMGQLIKLGSRRNRKRSRHLQSRTGRRDSRGTGTQGTFWGRVSLPKLDINGGCSTALFQRPTQQ